MLAYARLLRWQTSGVLDPSLQRLVGSRRETEWKAGPEPSDPALACLCKASPSRPGRLLSCLLVDIPQPSMFDRGPHLKRRFKKLAVVLLLAWRDGALTVSPVSVAKLRAQRRAAPRALNRNLGVTQLLMIRYGTLMIRYRVRRKTVSALVHFFRSFSFFMFVWFFLFPFSVGTYSYAVRCRCRCALLVDS